MLFFNDEGTENGGLIFGGQKNRDGTVSSYGHLSFDRYDQDQAFSLDSGQNGSNQSTGIALKDPPDWPLTEVLSLPPSQRPHFLATHARSTSRLTIARSSDGSAALALKDKEGHTRILLEVGSDGTPVIQVLDAKGGVVGQLPQSRPAG